MNAGTMLRNVAANIREGWIEPDRMTLDGVAFDCERVGEESMSESRERWATFVDDVARRLARSEPIAFDVHEVQTVGKAPRFTLDVRTSDAVSP